MLGPLGDTIPVTKRSYSLKALRTIETMVVMPVQNDELDDEKHVAEVKGPQRAKESMGMTTVSHREDRRSIPPCRPGTASQLSWTPRRNAVMKSSIGSKKKKTKIKRPIPFSWNSSISSISELEPVCFDDSGWSNMPSISQLTVSTDSLEMRISNFITQCPSMFEVADKEKKGAMAPQMPIRGNDSRKNLSYEDANQSSSSLAQ